jgi:hypothetical protein
VAHGQKKVSGPFLKKGPDTFPPPCEERLAAKMADSLTGQGKARYL